MKKILVFSIMTFASINGANATIVTDSVLSTTSGKYSSSNTVESAIADAKAAGTTAAATAENKVDKTQTVKGGVLTTNADTGAVEVSATIPTSKISGLDTALSSYMTVGTNQTITGTKTFPNTTIVTDANTAEGKASNGTTTVAAVTTGNVKDAIVALDSKKEEYGNKITTATGATLESYANSTTKYPSMLTVNAMIDNALSVTNEDVSGLEENKQPKSTKNYQLGAANGEWMDAGDLATKSTITNAEVDVNADIADSKIKLGTVSLPQAGASIATGDTLNTALGKLQKQITENATTAANNVTSDYSANGTQPLNGVAVDKALKTLDVATLSETNKVVRTITETDGKVSATFGQIGNADIVAAAGIESSKIADLASAVNATAGNTVGNFVLTVKVDKTKTPTEVTYQWEDLGR